MSTPRDETEASPAAWIESTVRAQFDAYSSFDPDSPRWVGVDGLLGDGALSLRALHPVVRSRVPAATAATYLAGWFAGSVAEVIGLCLATGRVGLVVDGERVRWHVNPGGWADRVEFGDVQAVVTRDHRWAGESGVEVVDSFDALLHRTVESFVSAVAPIVVRCHGLARVGLTGLWNEVGDGLVMVLRHTRGLELDQPMLDVVNTAVRLEGVPWRAHAELHLVDTAHGTACVGRKGGCCLAYKVPAGTVAIDDSDLDAATSVFRQRFPVTPDEPRYCTTCPLRDPRDAEDRQVFWFELCSRRDRINEGRTDS